jgi:hypothetical protein
MIKVKSLFLGWHEVSEEQAKRFVLTLKSGITAMNDIKRIEYINSRLQGATVQELLNN